MKNLFRSVVALSLVLALMMPLGMQTFAAEEITVPDASSAGDFVEPQSVDLIITYSMNAHRKSTTRMYVDIDLNCVPSVVRCGIKYLRVETRTGSSEKWETALKLDNYLVDDYTFEKTITFAVNKGSQYRLTGTFYAKKAWYSIQKTEYTSNVVTI